LSKETSPFKKGETYGLKPQKKSGSSSHQVESRKETIMARWRHSIPAWTMSPRGANPKFQAGVELGGISSVAARMIAITKLSNDIATIHNEPLLTSLHILHELRSATPKYRKFNNPNAISFKDLRRGIKRGDFPQVLAVTAPAFGFPGVERGAILSSDPKRVQMAKDLHLEAIGRAQAIKEDGLGEGVVIWWPAFDSRRLDLLDGTSVRDEEAWRRMGSFWMEILGETGAQVWLEWKPSDPGIDYICNLSLAISFCSQVNTQLDKNVMFINNEWAHLLIGGLSVAEGTKRTIDANLFTGFVHVNSAQLLPVPLEKKMGAGEDPRNIATGVDWDWAVGMGGKERWDDQQTAVGMLDAWEGRTKILAEHDINPAGQDPVAFARCSIKNLEAMLKAVRQSR